VQRRKPTTVNLTLAALVDFYTRSGLGPPQARRLDLPQQAPRALDEKDSTRWLRTVERWLSPRDRVIALLRFYAGLRLSELVALDLLDIQLSGAAGGSPPGPPTPSST
jgi:integrase/recombinase XerC